MEDIHERLQFWASHLVFRVTVLSLDTAVTPHVGDLGMQSETMGQTD